jgi:hypothetical protein
MQDDGNLVLFDTSNKTLWSSKKGIEKFMNYIEKFELIDLVPFSSDIKK